MFSSGFLVQRLNEKIICLTHRVNSVEKKPIQLRVDLEGEWVEKFELIKEKKGLTINTEVVRQMIKETYDRIKEEE